MGRATAEADRQVSTTCTHTSNHTLHSFYRGMSLEVGRIALRKSIHIDVSHSERGLKSKRDYDLSFHWPKFDIAQIAQQDDPLAVRKRKHNA